MNVTHWTPADRLRPLQRIEDGCQPRIEYSGGKYVVRQSGVRLDPSVTPQERWMDRKLEQAGVAFFWVAVVPGTAVAFYWALVEGTKLAYQFASNHPLGL